MNNKTIKKTSELNDKIDGLRSLAAASLSGKISIHHELLNEVVSAIDGLMIALIRSEAKKQPPTTDDDDDAYERVAMPEDLHHDTRQLVIDTANAMAEKLYRSQEKYGYTNGWRVPAEGEETGDGRNFWTREECLKALFRHLEKGDPIDCINYLAFMQANGWRTELPAQEHASE
ncbi:hypothetical protein KUQ33_004731 [Salmonella enterica]|nr:hypothetical protein [Salmonella enterica]EHR8820938.1 hypothetical protein [Salmonella enterica]